MFDLVLSNLNKTRERLDRSYEAQCPCHEDDNLSLTVSEKGGCIVLDCRAGCTTENIVSALGLEMSDLDTNQNNNSRKKQKRKVSEIYDDTEPGIKEKQDIPGLLELNIPDQLKDLIDKTPVWKQENAFQSLTEHEKKKIKGDIFENAPFQCLGVDHGYYYYLSSETKQIIKLSSNNHTSVNLISLADLKFWETYFKLEESNEISWKSAQNSLFRKCHKLGIFDPKMVRGCGAWYDEKRTVLHLGDRLRVDGNSMKIHDFKTRYIYEAQKSIEITDHKPLLQGDAVKFSKISEMFAWEKPVSARLFSGWCVIAPICGALLWRPHLWLTGSAGTGKSWIINYVVHKILGSISLFVQSNTTEASIRQTLSNNAFPLVFDEVGPENQTSQFRLQKIMDLMRQASSENSAGIIKGTQGGQTVTFRIRSCFMLASINVNLKQNADISSVSVLGLTKHIFNRQQSKFEKIKSIVNGTLTNDYCAALRARTVSMIPIIRQNADVFAAAVTTVLGEQRVGDQLGALLAGAYSLYSDNTISYEDAVEWVRSHDWETDRSDGEKDEARCLNHILQNVVSVEVNGRRFDRTLGNLIANVSDRLESSGYGTGQEDAVTPPPDPDKDIDRNDAKAFLKRHGMRVKDECLWISNSHREMKKLFKDTAWHTGWKNMLLRIDGAENAALLRFGPGTSTRAVGIPLHYIFGE